MTDTEKERMEILQKELKEAKKQNQKKKLKSLKLNYLYLKKVAPCLIASGLGIFATTKLINLRSINCSENYYIERNMDNHGKDKSLEWYEVHGSVKTSLLYYYDKYQWVEEEQEYQRNLKIYSLYKLENMTPEELLNSNAENLESILGKPFAEKVEHAKNITEEEKNWQNEIKLTLYSKDPEKTIPYEVTIKDYTEPVMIFVYFLELILISFATGMITLKVTDFEQFEKSKAKILKELNLIDEEKIANELKLLRSKLGE